MGDEEEVETYHDRIRETTLNHLPTNVVKNLHCRIATVLETASAGPQRIEGERIPQTSATVAAEIGTLALKNRESKRIFDLAYHFDAAGESRAGSFPMRWHLQ